MASLIRYAVGNKQAHVELAARIKKRDANLAPKVGDRVPYVMIKAASGAKAWEKAEDPIYVLENNIPLDTDWWADGSRLRWISPGVPAAGANSPVGTSRMTSECLPRQVYGHEPLMTSDDL